MVGYSDAPISLVLNQRNVFIYRAELGLCFCGLLLSEGV